MHIAGKALRVDTSQGLRNVQRALEAAGHEGRFWAAWTVLGVPGRPRLERS